MNLKERANNYNRSFPAFAKQAPLVATDRWLYGVWMIGNNYQSKNKYYGEYPPGFLKRIYSIFPDVKEDEVLHLFSGSLDEGERGDRVDINPDNHPTYVCDAEHLSQVIKKTYKLIVADPPYSEEDALHYGTPMINRRKAIKECVEILEKGGFIVWLDQVYPMYSKEEIELIGTIGLIRSTNHRVRVVFIYQKTRNII